MPQSTQQYKTVYIASAVHYALKVAAAAERTNVTAILTDAVEGWCANGRSMGEPSVQSHRTQESAAYLRTEAHQKLKVACAERGYTIVGVINHLAVEWLRKHGHARVLDAAMKRVTS